MLQCKQQGQDWRAGRPPGGVQQQQRRQGPRRRGDTAYPARVAATHVGRFREIPTQRFR